MATLSLTYKSLPVAIHAVIKCAINMPLNAPLPLATGNMAARRKTPRRAPEVAEVTRREPSTTPPTRPTDRDRHMIVKAVKMLIIVKIIQITYLQNDFFNNLK